MLILARRQGESVTFSDEHGESFTVCVHKISGNRVKLAINAPQRFRVRRSELTPRPAVETLKAEATP
jgi:carbon storage regulator CsrA